MLDCVDIAPKSEANTPICNELETGGDGSIIVLAYTAFYAYNLCMQYTIRNIPEVLDAALRRSAREQGKSLNKVAIEALARGSGLGESRHRQRDLSDIAGSWRSDPAFDSALAAQDAIDAELWR